MRSLRAFLRDVIYPSRSHPVLVDQGWRVTSYTVEHDGQLSPVPSAEVTAWCSYCGVQVDLHNDVWWQTGTCGASCPMNPGGPHVPIFREPEVVPIHDREALEEWLDS